MAGLIKGFCHISSLINNTASSLSPIGELSSFSRTFSKDKGEYSHEDVTGYSLTTFTSKLLNGSPFVLSAGQVKQIMEVVRFCVTRASGLIQPYNSNDFKNAIDIQFFERISNVRLGEFVTGGTIALPEYVKWVSDEFNDNQITIWLADESFRYQYDEYEITVVPITDDIDAFTGFYAAGTALIDSVSVTDFNNRIIDAKNNLPDTATRMYQFDYVNKMNAAQKKPCLWAAIIYGNAGDNIDAVKLAIADYIAANSNELLSLWETIFPEIYEKTEFVFFPRWDLIAVDNLSQSSVLYRSIVNASEAIDFAVNAASFYEEAFVRANTSILPFDYKTMTLVCVNGNNNIAGSETLLDLFPDYLPISSLSADFGRMSTQTQNWAAAMQKLILAAENVSNASEVDPNIRILTRNNNLYASLVIDEVNYLVAARTNTY